MKNLKIIIIGIITGIICGLFATGGGLILVPALVYLIKIDDRKARGTAICSILPMVIASSIFYYKDNFFDFKVGILCAIGGIIGGIIGTRLLKSLPIKYIRILFAIFLFYVSIKMLIKGG